MRDPQRIVTQCLSEKQLVAASVAHSGAISSQWVTEVTHMPMRSRDRPFAPYSRQCFPGQETNGLISLKYTSD